ncbi:MAG: sigma-70 family RNA polymerase sigma factor [Bacteroidales bacterium]|nr:sigma-70 family RNA polymerase sigma factor [Bacteroidales bacterium]
MEITANLTNKALRDYKLVVAAIEGGDQKAYSQLMDNYKDSVYFMLLKMTNNADDADDLTIEAFGKAFRNLHQYTPDFAFSTWLFKIASNNCIDYIRKKRKNLISIDRPFENVDTTRDQGLEIPSGTLDPEEVFIKQQKIKLLRELVEKLKPRYRKLVEMRYFSEYSYEEIAVELKLPIGTVKAQLFRARELLYNILKKTQHTI